MSTTLRTLMVRIGMDFSQYTKSVGDLKAKQREVEAQFNNSTGALENWEKSVVGLRAKVSEMTQKLQLQAQIIGEHRAAMEAAKNAEGDNAGAVDEATKKYNTANRELRSIKSELEKYKGELGKAEAAENGVGNGANQMGQQIQGAGTKTGGLKAKLSEFAGSAVGQFASVAGAVMLAKQALQKVVDLIEEAAKFGDEMMKMSKKTGIAVDQLQALSYAAIETDTDLESITTGLARLTKSIGGATTGNKDLSDTFASLGVSLKDDVTGNLKDSEQIFYDTIDAIGKVDNETQADIITQKLFGRSFQDLKGLIDAGGDELKKYTDEAKATGIVLNKGLIVQLDKMADQTEKLSAKFESFGRRVVAGLAPAITSVEKFAGEAMDSMSKWFAQQTGWTDGVDRFQSVWLQTSDSLDLFSSKYQYLTAELMAKGYDKISASTTALDLLEQMAGKTGGLKSLNSAMSGVASEASEAAQNFAEFRRQLELSYQLYSTYGPSGWKLIARKEQGLDVKIPGYAEGGLNMSQGLAYLHPNELVLPLGDAGRTAELLGKHLGKRVSGSGGGGSYTFNAQLNVDGHALAKATVKYTDAELKALQTAQGRGRGV